MRIRDILAALAMAGASGSTAAANDLEAAHAAMAAQDYESAARLARKADKAAKGQCGECLVLLGNVHYRRGEHRDAIDAARRATGLTEGVRQGEAYALLGRSILDARLKDDAKSYALLLEAEQAFRKLLELEPAQRDGIQLALAETFYRLGRPAAARALAEEIAGNATASDARRSKARWLLNNPRCVAEPCPQDLSFATTDGGKHTLRGLEGRVVLFSFWATWCGPCRTATPDLKRLHARFRDQPFVMVGVNMDEDRDAMARYLAEQKIEWPQSLDEGRALYELFGIDGIPAEIVVDHEGVLVGRSAGWSDGIAAGLSERIEQALRRARRAQEPLVAQSKTAGAP